MEIIEGHEWHSEGIEGGRKRDYPVLSVFGHTRL